MQDDAGKTQPKTGEDRTREDRELFDRIARQYLRKDQTPASRAARRQRLFQTVRDLGLTPESRLLEVGCGAGFTAEFLEGHYGHYTGLDYSGELVDQARRLHGRANREFLETDFFEFTPGETYDAVVMIGVLHHMVDPAAAVRKVSELLKPGGCFAANEPAPGNPVVRRLRCLRKKVDDSYSDEQLELAAEDALPMLEQAGFHDVRAIPQGLVSTPFAEVVINPQALSAPLAKLACRLDTATEALPAPLTRFLCWNLIFFGRKPA